MPGRERSACAGERLILIAGGLVPALVLAALLVFSLPYRRPRAVAPADLRIEVTGEQFWWRVAYRPSDGPAVAGADAGAALFW